MVNEMNAKVNEIIGYVLAIGSLVAAVALFYVYGVPAMHEECAKQNLSFCVTAPARTPVAEAKVAETPVPSSEELQAELDEAEAQANGFLKQEERRSVSAEEFEQAMAAAPKATPVVYDAAKAKASAYAMRRAEVLAGLRNEIGGIRISTPGPGTRMRANSVRARAERWAITATELGLANAQLVKLGTENF